MSQERHVILDTLRERICLVPPGEQAVLKEKELGEEFGLSRTPIRQLLQTLANEGMVVVRPGYGTVTTELKQFDRNGHLEVFRQLALSSAAVLDRVPVSEEAKMELSALHGFTSNVKDPTLETFLRLNGRLVRALTASLDDPILVHAFRAAQWRVVRWRADDMKHDFMYNWNLFAGNVERGVQMSFTCTAADLMEIAATAVESYKSHVRLRQVAE